MHEGLFIDASNWFQLLDSSDSSFMSDTVRAIKSHHFGELDLRVFKIFQQTKFDMDTSEESFEDLMAILSWMKQTETWHWISLSFVICEEDQSVILTWIISEQVDYIWLVHPISLEFTILKGLKSA